MGGVTYKVVYRASDTRAAAAVRCRVARELMRAAYGQGPLRVIRVVQPKVGRGYVWVRGGWQCFTGAGGAACRNVKRRSLNVLRDRFAVTANVA